MATYDHNRFGYEQDEAVWIDGDVIGKRYNSNAIILDCKQDEDDSVLVLMVEEDDEHPGEPFVITRLYFSALDVRHDLDLGRIDTIRYALIAWESL